MNKNNVFALQIVGLIIGFYFLLFAVTFIVTTNLFPLLIGMGIGQCITWSVKRFVAWRFA